MSGAAPTFSVVMPVYNGQRFVRRSIGSIQGQTDEDWELVVVDDGSTDGSVDLLRQLGAADSRIRLFHSPSSGGPATPRTIGLREARGEIVCLIDQDDEWLPEKLSRQRAKFADGDFGMVYSDCFVEDSGAERFRYSERWGPMHEGSVAGPLIDNNFVPALTAAIRMSVVREIGGFTPDLDGVDDYDYWLRVAFHGQRFGWVAEPLAVWHLDDHNMSRRNPVRQQLRLYKCYTRLAKRYPAYAADLRRSAARARRSMFDHNLSDLGQRPATLRSSVAVGFAVTRRARSRRELRAAVAGPLKGIPRRYTRASR